MTILCVFVKGVVLGLSLAAPVGPIGVLCIQRTLRAGRLIGLISGLGAATADGLYGLIAAGGFTMLANVLIAQQLWLRVLGGGFLGYLGVKTFLSPPATHAAPDAPTSTWLNAYSSTLLLTLTNPLTILAFTAIFAGVGIVDAAAVRPAAASVLVGGVFCGSALWWGILSSVTALLRHKLTPPAFVWLNRASGLIMLTFGMVALAGIFY